ncbi:MAG: flap endonuclease-1 [Thermoproteota archaeon]
MNLTPIIPKKRLRLESLRDKSFAVDGNQMLYQFLAIIRKPDGTFFTDPEGNVTSHLIGLAFRLTRMMCSYSMRFVMVFDGEPVRLKSRVLEKRRIAREKAFREWMSALSEGRLTEAFSKAVSLTRLTRKMVEDAKKFLGLIGIPFINSPSDAEAQAAFIAGRGDVYAVAGRDYDTLLYGSPRLLRNLAIRSTEFLPSKGYSKILKPELVEMDEVLRRLSVNREQLIDIAILVGTDFNEGVRGIGPKKALNLIKKYGRIEGIPGSIITLPERYDEVRRIFMEPDIREDYSLRYTGLDEDGLMRFLHEEKGFSRERVIKLIGRMKRFYKSANSGSTLREWLS